MYHTFGCKLNFAETSTLRRDYEAAGYVTVHDGDTTSVPDVVVINSCSVTEVADRKCRQYIRSVNRRYPEASIVVTGCYAQLKADEIAALPGVRIVAGTDRKGRLVEMTRAITESSHVYVTPTPEITEFTPSCARGDRTRFFLKVQDGCNYRCSYCTIPKARGRSRWAPVADIVEQARRAAEAGGREIVITGVNIGDYGRGGEESFLDLLKALDGVDGIERYRISSIEPNLITDEIIEWCAGSRAFMPHFHIPLQSGSDTVLGLMRRRYRTELFAHRVETIRRVMPDAFIGVDLIAGSRGETPNSLPSRKHLSRVLTYRVCTFLLIANGRAPMPLTSPIVSTRANKLAASTRCWLSAMPNFAASPSVLSARYARRCSSIPMLTVRWAVLPTTICVLSSMPRQALTTPLSTCALTALTTMPKPYMQP